MTTAYCFPLSSVLLAILTTVRASRTTIRLGKIGLTRDPVNTTTEQKLLYVIGDSHGNTNYLVRSLLATERFMLDANENIIWNDAAMRSETLRFEVIVLGDFIDRGDRPRTNAMLLKRLCGHPIWGNHLVVTMGNHEQMLLRWEESYAQKQTDKTDWPTKRRREDLSATEGEGHELITWLTERPVIYMSQGVLMMHGGLSMIVLHMVINDLIKSGSQACAVNGIACGEAVVRFINSLAGNFYANLHQCLMGATTDEERASCDERVGGRPYVVASSRLHIPSWSKSGGGGGVLWFKSYTAVSFGAGTAEACKEASAVIRMLGAQTMVAAHVTHKRIAAYCNQLIFVVDTHMSDCNSNDECDFSRDHRFHKGGKFHAEKSNVPQVLRIQRMPDGSSYVSTCLSMYSKSSGGVKVECSVFTADVGKQETASVKGKGRTGVAL